MRNHSVSSNVKAAVKSAIHKSGGLPRKSISILKRLRLNIVVEFRYKVSQSINSWIYKWSKAAHSNRLEALVIDETTPTPDRDSGSLDTVYRIRVLLDLGFKVTFIPNNLKYLARYTDDIRSLGANVLTKNEISSIKSFLKRSGSELDVVFLHRVGSAANNIAAVKEFASNAKIIFETVDLHYLREQRQAEISNCSQDRTRAAITKSSEFNIMRAADASIVLSETEYKLIKAEDASINLLHIPYIREAFEIKKPFHSRKDILFIGGFLHQPNVDAIRYFIHEIWPLVKQQIDELDLLVIGSNITEELIGLGRNDNRIRCIGYVRDLEPYFSQCRLSIAPLRYGAGIKGKIGTSACHGVPCVATSIAAEGMGLENGSDVLVADDPLQFAEQIVKLYLNEELWNTISGGCHSFARVNFSYEAGRDRIRNMLGSLEVCNAQTANTSCHI